MQTERRDLLKVLACLAAPGWAAPNPLLRFPYLQRVQADRASVLWTSTNPSGGSVTVVNNEDGTSLTTKAVMRTFPTSETNEAETFYQYRADITGLQPGTLYSYRVAIGGVDIPSPGGGLFRFRTAAAGRFSFLALGDSGENSEPQRQIMAAMNAETGVAMAIHTGDLAYPLGSFAIYESAYFGMNASRMSSLPIYPTPGNHDYLGDAGIAYLASHAAPDCDAPEEDTGRYYSYDWGDAHFTSLDSNLLFSDANERMLNWLRRDLARTRKFWKIVYFHHPPYPTGHHIADPVAGLVREQVLPILEAAGVQLSISGHEHGYERSHTVRGGLVVQEGPSTTYIITGGGGAGLHALGALPQTAVTLSLFHYMRFDVDGYSITGRALDGSGNTLDRFVVSPKPELKANGIVNGGDFTPAVAPGSLAVLFGNNLAIREFAASAPFPSELGDLTLTVNGEPAQLLYVSPSQVNFLVPESAPAVAPVELQAPHGSVKTQLVISECAPAILSVRPGTDGRLAAYVTGFSRWIHEISVWVGGTVIDEPGKVQTSLVGPGVYRVDIGPLALPAGEYSLRVAARNSLSAPASFRISG